MSATSSLIVALASWKGGVGKSTITAAAAAEWTRRGKRVAVIDLDATSNVSLTLSKIDPDVCNITYSSMAAVAEKNPAGVTKQIRALSQTHDVILIDTPGAIETAGAQMALLVSNLVLIPFKPGGYELDCTIQTMDLIDSIRVVKNPDLKSLILTNQPKRTVLARDASAALNDILVERTDHRMMDSVLSDSVVFGEMVATGGLLWSMGAGAKKASLEVSALVDEIETELTKK